MVNIKSYNLHINKSSLGPQCFFKSIKGILRLKSLRIAALVADKCYWVNLLKRHSLYFVSVFPALFLNVP